MSSKAFRNNEITLETGSESKKALQEEIKEHNRKLQKAFFKKLAQMFIDITRFKNTAEFNAYSNRLVHFLLANNEGQFVDAYSAAEPCTMMSADFKVRIALLKEFGHEVPKPKRLIY